MTSPMNPSSRSPDPSASPDHASPDAAADRRLQQALRELPVPAQPERLAALQAQVLAQWQASHGAAAEAQAHGAQGGRLVLAGGGRRRWLLGSAMVLGGLALGLGLWLKQPDPALEELLQPDVLSQMAIGEM
jgi:hypothetical protein